MNTTRVYAQWTASGTTTGRPALDTLTAVAGDFAADYDLDAAETDYLAELDRHLPGGYHIARNGQLYGPADDDWFARNFEGEVDYLGFIEDIDVNPILARHERHAEADTGVTPED
jgi:hypothetical protein